MGLVEYRKKRSFSKTPEPTGGKATGKKLQFVVQKHDASRLHYDFRIELNGVLKSWAVPKGPSMNPAEKRLAMMVEDHPFDYKNFEGIIPEGNYGAGTVIIWDEGYYEPVEDVGDKKAQEKYLESALRKGSIKIRMFGAKLQGEFALVLTKGRGQNSWLLIKHRDEFASDDDIREEDTSVHSGMTVEEVASDKNARQWGSHRSSRKKAAAEKPSPRKSSSRKSPTKVIRMASDTKEKQNFNPADLLKDIKGKKRSPVPEDIKPMLATLVNQPFDEDGWLYEVKWDGYRAISYMMGGNIEIRSRNNKDFSKKFYPVFEGLQQWGVDAVVDGEIIVVNEKGEPDFNALQGWRSEADGQLIYYVFDLLWLGGYDLMNVPLHDRKKLLSGLVPGEGILRLSDDFATTGTEFFKQADKMGLEGIMAKKEGSIYMPDVRSKEWLKIKTQKEQEAIIAGYTRNENSSKKFSALLMGVYDKGKLVFIGPVGTGFTAKTQTEILNRLKPLETSKCPFAEEPDYNKPSRFRPNPPKAEVTWVKPVVVAEVIYRARSSDGSMRHPSFKGIREDKNAREVGFEKEVSVSKVVAKDTDKATSHQKNIITPPERSERKTFLNPKDETQVRNINGHDLKFTNLSKVFWPEEGLTKRDMLNYYYQVVPYMLPYMKDRPQTLNRFPNGIYGQSFYQKDVTGKVPSWIETYQYFSEGDQRKKHFLVATDEASLLYIASLGCIEMNPWSSRTMYPDNPDWCIIDLDPGKKTSFDHVIEAARLTRDVLDSVGVETFCKTSGSTGLHIYVPLGAKYIYEDSKEFARAIVKIVHAELPSTTSIERKVSDREGKMYLDFLQNRPQATVAGPYSLRPKPGAPVSMPLHWEEVKKGLSIRDFTLTNAPTRLKREGDIFAGVLGKGVDIGNSMTKLMKTFGKVNS
jgi:bifunctional non-homologous end joining protein LigD